MEKQDNNQDIKILEMAKKRRYIHLLEKMQKGKSSSPSLNKSEIKELEAFAKDPNAPGIVDSQEKVAKVFGVATRTVERWAKDGMPVTPQGSYDLLEIRAWRMIKNQKKGKADKNKGGIDWENRYREYKAKLAEISLKKAVGELITKDLVEKDLIQISLTIKQSFLSLPRQVAPQLAGLEPRQIEKILSDRIKEIVHSFSDGSVFNQLRKELSDGKGKYDTKLLD